MFQLQQVLRYNNLALAQNDEASLFVVQYTFSKRSGPEYYVTYYSGFPRKSRASYYNSLQALEYAMRRGVFGTFRFSDAVWHAVRQ